MDTVAEKHADFISRLTRLLELFVAMRYVSSADVVHPPHSPQTIATDTFQRLGFEPEVIDLMKLMPALRSDVVWGYQWYGIELLPRSKTVTYFADASDPDWIEDLRWGERTHSENTKLLPPWLLRLTSGSVYSGQYGVDLIYNTHDRTIIEWHDIGQRAWDESPSRPADVVLDELISKFQSLEWVPYYDPDDSEEPPSRKIVEDPIIMQNLFPGGIRLPTDATVAIQQLRAQHGPQGADDLRRRINRWKALQKMYHDCGWGSENFDGEAFERTRVIFIRTLAELERLEHESRYSHPGQQQLSAGEVTSRLDRFLVQGAGENAV